MYVSFYYAEKQAGFLFGNVGLGPARLDSFSVLVDGKPQQHWTAMFESLGFDQVPDYSFTVPRVETWYKPDSPVSWILSVPSGPAYHRLRDESERIEIKGCYCSLYDECWLFNRSSKKTPVASCSRDTNIIFSAPAPPAETDGKTKLDRFAYVLAIVLPRSEHANLTVVPGGAYYLQDVKLRIVNLANVGRGATGQNYELKLVDPKQPPIVSRIDLRSTNEYALNIFLENPDGEWNQELRLRKIRGRWSHGTRVTIRRSFVVIHQSADPSFPRSATGEIEGIAEIPKDPMSRRYFGLVGELRRF